MKLLSGEVDQKKFGGDTPYRSAPDLVIGIVLLVVATSSSQLNY